MPLFGDFTCISPKLLVTGNSANAQEPWGWKMSIKRKNVASQCSRLGLLLSVAVQINLISVMTGLLKMVCNAHRREHFEPIQLKQCMWRSVSCLSHWVINNGYFEWTSTFTFHPSLSAATLTEKICIQLGRVHPEWARVSTQLNESNPPTTLKMEHSKLHCSSFWHNCPAIARSPPCKQFSISAFINKNTPNFPGKKKCFQSSQRKIFCAQWLAKLACHDQVGLFSTAVYSLAGCPAVQQWQCCMIKAMSSDWNGGRNARVIRYFHDCPEGTVQGLVSCVLSLPPASLSSVHPSLVTAIT